MKRLKSVVFVAILFVTTIKSLATNFDKLEPRHSIIFLKNDQVINDT